MSLTYVRRGVVLPAYIDSRGPSGRWLTAPFWGDSATTQTHAGANGRCTPLPLLRATTFQAIGCKLANTPTAATTCRFAIYGSDQFYRPAAPLVVDAGSVTLVGPAFYSKAISVTLGPGLWYLTMLPNNVGATPPAFDSVDVTWSGAWISYDTAFIQAGLVKSEYELVGIGAGAFPADPLNPNIVDYHASNQIVWAQVA